MKLGLGMAGGTILLSVAGLAIAQGWRGPRADLNGDGKITQDEIVAASKARFADADTNKDGKLAGDEIPHPHMSWGGRHHGPNGSPPPPPADAGPPQQGLPPGAMEGPLPNDMRGPPRPSMDGDGDGVVTLAEYTDWMKSRLDRADANHDGTITQDELDAARPHRGGR